MPFAIDETSGELFTTNILDRETVAIYNLEVTASDKHPIQPLSSSVLVTVLIGDINDHWPQFMNGPYVAYVPIELAPGERLPFYLTAICFILGNIGNRINIVLSPPPTLFFFFCRLCCLCSESIR